MLKVADVFVPGSMPSVTYVPRTVAAIEERLEKAIADVAKVVTVLGPTKVGKTVLVERLFPRDSGRSIWIDGGLAASEDRFWQQVLLALGSYDSIQRSEGAASGQGFGGEVGGSLKIPFVASGSGKTSATTNRSSTKSSSTSLKLDFAVAAINALKHIRIPLIIDDFHYIPREAQAKILRALKPLIFSRQPVILIAVPHHRYDAVSVERELTGRVSAVEIPSWSISDLMQIGTSGFRALNLSVSITVLSELAAESYGSPHLMQDFCRALCDESGIVECLASRHPLIVPEMIRIYTAVANAGSRDIYERLLRGPNPARRRKQWALTDGGNSDIYQLATNAIAKLEPGLSLIDSARVSSAIAVEVRGSAPSRSEVAEALKRLASVASNDANGTPVIDWHDENQELYVTDPFFAFFLKWAAQNKFLRWNPG